MSNIKFFAPSLLLVFMFSQGAFARLPINWAPLLQTTAGQQMMGRLTGKSIEQIGQMGLAARQSALMESLKNDRELSTQLSQISNEISQSSNPKIVAESLLAKVRWKREGLAMEGTGIVVNPKSPKGLMGRIRAEGMTARLTEALRSRPEIPSSVANKILKAGQNFKKGTGMELYGPDAAKCVANFEKPLVETLAQIVSGVARGGKMTSLKEAFQVLVQGARGMSFRESMSPRDRVCKLAGKKGSSCSIFSLPVANNCG